MCLRWSTSVPYAGHASAAAFGTEVLVYALQRTLGLLTPRIFDLYTSDVDVMLSLGPS